MPTRRQALGALVWPVLPAACARGLGPGAASIPAPPRRGEPDEVARDEDYRAEVARAFTIIRDEFRGLRVSPSVYTTLEEQDRFCTVMEKVIRNGLPA